MSEFAANPLYQFRAPNDRIQRANVEAGYFTTKRRDVVNDTGVFNVYPGTFQWIANPAAEVDIAIWEDNADPKSKANYYNLVMREGFNVCMYAEWLILDDAVAMVWQRDQAGRITFGGQSVNTLVLLFRTGEEADASQKRRQIMTEQMNKTPEQLTAEANEKLAPLGAEVEVTYEDDDGSDDKPKRKRR